MLHTCWPRVGCRWGQRLMCRACQARVSCAGRPGCRRACTHALSAVGSAGATKPALVRGQPKITVLLATLGSVYAGAHPYGYTAIWSIPVCCGIPRPLLGCCQPQYTNRKHSPLPTTPAFRRTPVSPPLPDALHEFPRVLNVLPRTPLPMHPPYRTSVRQAIYLASPDWSHQEVTVTVVPGSITARGPCGRGKPPPPPKYFAFVDGYNAPPALSALRLSQGNGTWAAVVEDSQPSSGGGGGVGDGGNRSSGGDGGSGVHGQGDGGGNATGSAADNVLAWFW